MPRHAPRGRTTVFAEQRKADSPQFALLVQETSRNFTIGEVSADKAYASLEY